jgi:hypothetical protein
MSKVTFAGRTLLSVRMLTDYPGFKLQRQLVLGAATVDDLIKRGF